MSNMLIFNLQPIERDVISSPPNMSPTPLAQSTTVAEQGTVQTSWNHAMHAAWRPSSERLERASRFQASVAVSVSGFGIATSCVTQTFGPNQMGIQLKMPPRLPSRLCDLY